ncbi:MAG: RHS repeat-associated core domain-containing protein [Negativicutes bacterium]|nr:RHS repeat-associated core domain-containing protein [Negativicutes bacterium]
MSTGEALIGYDSLNRLTSATAAPAVQGTSSFAWTYDSFGNRLGQGGDGGMNIWTQSGNDANGNPHNQVTGTNARGVSWTPDYDAAGNMLDDGANQYLYDADGHVCAVRDLTYGGMTGYLYNASGQRVAKGTIASWSCDTTANGFTLTRQYILGPNGEQMTEIAYSYGSGWSTSTWVHTNVVAGGVIATYLPDGASPHFRLTDWLGTTRVQTNNTGAAELTCQSLPFGDTSAQCAPATEQFFTGKERDTESGNDYFGARHYSSNMGRFLSPDPSGLSLADITNPQSLNLYAYVINNPLISVDQTGLDGCQVDGVDTDCSALNSGAATACPANLCGVVSIGQYGVGSGIQLAQFYAGGGGAQGFVAYNLNDPSGTYNELGGEFVDDQEWDHDVLQPYIDGMIGTLGTKMGINLSAGACEGGLRGGNLNCTISASVRDTYRLNHDCKEGDHGQYRCSGSGYSLHFHAPNKETPDQLTFHMDSADPGFWSGPKFSGLLDHLIVDVIGGHTIFVDSGVPH